MNETLATAAKHATSAPHFVKDNNSCMQFVREVVQSKYGDEFDEYFYKGTARGSMNAFKKSPYWVDPDRGSVPGDILFTDAGGDPRGHVGIRVKGNRVAENSSAHWNGEDARGFRSLKRFGKVIGIVRLPE